ncbi:MAG TPA: histone deacetylase [Gaiellales bacterium]|nr:histone deacetylase [Gaiellales bacterium]
MSQTRPLACYVSDLFREHDPGRHPERPARIDAVMQAVRAVRAPVEEAGAASQDDLERVHPPAFLAAIRELCEAGGGAIDLDTVVSERSYDAAVTASGAATAAVDAVLAGDLGAAFCLGRPPGHHAEAARAMGFCLVNHAAVAVAHARAAGVDRVAVLDWDAHHGNGTQAIFWDDPAVLYVSLHQYPFYPGTGSRAERGGGAGEGTTVNIPLTAGASEREFTDAFESEALPALGGFDPDLLIVSAGFDAHRDDPLCDLGLSSAAFGDLTRTVRGIGAGPVLILEGGYDLTALYESVSEVLAALG